MNAILIRQLGMQNYQACWQAMQDFTNQREPNSPDEIWLVQHPAVFTQGQNGKPEHLLAPGNIPVVQIDRGGQVTYHGPGQLIAYVLVDLKRRKLNIREFVSVLEKSVIEVLAEYRIPATTQCKAPGVYTHDKKICSIGLRVRRSCSYHGLALNVDMNLEPFTRINPCGFNSLQMTQMVEFSKNATMADVEQQLIHFLVKNLTVSQFPTEKNYE